MRGWEVRNAYTFEEKGAILTQSVRNGFFFKKKSAKVCLFQRNALLLQPNSYQKTENRYD